jgi:cell division septal protein FtsQ
MLWFGKKAKNRRFVRAHVLDVKLRNDQVRSARTRLLAMCLGILFAMVAGVYALWMAGEYALRELVYRNQAFEIRQIDVQTDGILAVDHLRHCCDVKEGENLMALDLSQVKRELELIPVVDTASVERILPHTLRIRVTEREPIVQVVVPRPRPGGGLDLAIYHLDAEGNAMQPLDANQRTLPPAQSGETQLPTLSGLNAAELQAGRRLSSPQVQSALKLVLAFEQSPMAGLVELKRIDVSAPDVLMVNTSEGSEVVFNNHNPEQQLRRWREIHDLGMRMNKAIASVDLAVSNSIPVRWLEAANVSPPPPRIPRPTRNKRKHV